MDTERQDLHDWDRYVCDSGTGEDLDVEDAFGEHNIEYWVRKGNRLVPATPEESAQIQEWERERRAEARLAQLKEAQRRALAWPARLRSRLSLSLTRWPALSHRQQPADQEGA
jgi:hypothetical protein